VQTQSIFSERAMCRSTTDKINALKINIHFYELQLAKEKSLVIYLHHAKAKAHIISTQRNEKFR
jgi:hypothetical protein